MCDKSLKMFEGPCGGGSGSAGDTEHVLMRVIASVQPQDTGHKAGGTHGGGGPPEHQARHPRRPRRGARAANLTKPPLKPGPRSLVRQARAASPWLGLGPGSEGRRFPPRERVLGTHQQRPRGSLRPHPRRELSREGTWAALAGRRGQAGFPGGGAGTRDAPAPIGSGTWRLRKSCGCHRVF